MSQRLRQKLLVMIRLSVPMMTFQPIVHLVFFWFYILCIHFWSLLRCINVKKRFITMCKAHRKMTHIKQQNYFHPVKGRGHNAQFFIISTALEVMKIFLLFYMCHFPVGLTHCDKTAVLFSVYICSFLQVYFIVLGKCCLLFLRQGCKFVWLAVRIVVPVPQLVNFTVAQLWPKHRLLHRNNIRDLLASTTSFSFSVCHIFTPYLHLATSEMWCWSGGRGILKLSLCYH